MNQYRLIFILFIGLITTTAFAQNKISGKLSDHETREVLPYATVRLLQQDSTFVAGTVTDSLRHYRISDIKNGDYLLYFSTIGYKPKVIQVSVRQDTNLPTVEMESDNVMLEGVTVTGSSFIQKKDHLLILPSKEQVKHSFTGYDLLYNLMIPGLTVNRKDKTVTSMTGKATLYINGIEADAKEIQSLQPKDIERVEYYVLPTNGQFTGDAASVNYITKTYKTGGYITIDGLQNIGYLKGDYNIGAKVSHNNTNYSFWAGHTMQRYQGVETEKEELLSFPDHVINRNTTNNGAAYKNNQQYTQFKVSNDNEKRNLSASFAVVRDETPRNNHHELLNYTGDNAYNTESEDKNRSKSLRSTLNLTGNFVINKHHQLKFRLNGGYTQNHYKRNYTEGELRSVSDVDEDLYSFDGQVAHLFQISPSNSLYSRVTHFHNVTSSLYNGDYPSWQHLWKGETLFQFDYMHQFGEKLIMMISPGASWLNYKLHDNNRVGSWNLRINSWLRYIPNSKQWAGIGFSYGNNQPDISYLNTSRQTVDSYQIKQGNPFLRNTTLYNCFFMYVGQLHRLFNIQSRAWYSMNCHNVFTDYFIENNKLISSYRSDDSYNTANVELSVSSRITPRLQTNIGLKYSYMYVPGKSGLSQNNYSASFDINYFIRAFSINAYARSTERILDEPTLAFRKLPASYGLSVRYSKKNWMTEIGTENPFTKHQHYREYANYGIYKYNQLETRRIYQQTAYIKMAYTFDFGKKTTRDANDVDRSINSAILKVN